MAQKKKEFKTSVDIAIEFSWEVCNKVGGINTVLASKADQMIKAYGNEGYYLVGPYIPEKFKHQFEEKSPTPELRPIFENLDKEGIYCHFGNWLISGNPRVILIDFKNTYSNLNDYKWQLWDSYKVDSLNSGFDFNEPVVWGYAAAKFLKGLCAASPDKKIVGHFHEWLAGAALLFSKKFNPNIATVFTTHATTLGRSLAYNSVDFYSDIQSIDPQKEAYHFGIQSKHLLEKAAAEQSSVFTTVSEITGLECQYFLGRKPDIVLPNGLDVGKYLTFEDLVIKHRTQRSRLREFLFYYFFPHYTFDLKNTLFYFIMSRYEFHAKGIDSMIKSLGIINDRLKKERSEKTIVTFFWVPAYVKEIKQEIIENRSSYFEIKQFVQEDSEDLADSFMYSLFSTQDLKDTDVFEDNSYSILENKLKKIRRTGVPPLSTHELVDPNDQIIQAFRAAGLDNKQDDRVKVVFYPIYLTESDKLLNLSPQGAVQGCHLGIFPSYYEPWGYTPLEAAVEAVPAVTSDLSGVGRFMEPLTKGKDNPGIFVVNNFKKEEKQVVDQMADIFYDFAHLPQKDRVEDKIEAKDLVSHCDWSNLVENYLKAHDQALGE
ncbi:MAG: hypothetical protein WC397_01445 [Candidatus Paceibacterota bacterium]|jgi:glycogen(starch) synthase